MPDTRHFQPSPPGGTPAAGQSFRPRFSSRLPATLAPNRLTRAIERLRTQGTPFIDLTETNPTRVGAYPDGLLTPLADPAGLTYAPAPRGAAVAREAIAIAYVRRGLDVDPSQVVVTASTSEAYGFLFKLLCDPGDEVLVPTPSYPLFEHLTGLEAVRPVAYRLDYHGAWRIDFASVERALSPRSRALLIVSPNNPTGSCLTRGELDRLVDICRTHGIALIGDEVFADYPLTDRRPERPEDRPSSVLAQRDVLTIALGGLSKSVGLPQLKLGWMVVAGPADAQAAALDRLEWIADTYLSVSTPVQLAAPALLDAGHAVRTWIQHRITGNLHALARAVAQAPACTLLAPDAGWSAVVRVPAIVSEEELVMDLLEQNRVLVAPGYFYDFDTEAFVILSLLPRPDEYLDGVTRLLQRVTGLVRT